MKILFTGGSSFTGYWFIRELVTAGHDVVATFTQSPEHYEGIRRERMTLIHALCETRFNCRFGDVRFQQLIAAESHWDLLCHHGADATDYRRPEFDYASALQSNTYQIRSVFEKIASKGCTRIVATGSVFEAGEGAGSEDLPSFSPYGLSKALTWQVINHFANETGLTAAKFVIPNPFGPYEEARFCNYLIRTWYAGEKATVMTPDYIRDNIHVSLLAGAYRQMVGSPEIDKLNPSGYVESQGQFAERFQASMADRLKLECALELQEQTELSEPGMRINTDSATALVNDWSESAAWDDLAEYYRGVFA